MAWAGTGGIRMVTWPRRLLSRPLPGSKHRRVGEIYLPLFIEIGGLTRDQAVLEPGCGTGRMAEPLTGYLAGAGTYDGFDVVSKAVRWCTDHISANHPNFRFQHVDVFNRAYNPKGRLDPTRFSFPYADEAFDFVFLTSVFTHMLPPEIRHYLREIKRVLRPEGRCLATFFLLNERSVEAARDGTASRRFQYEGDGYSYDYAASPEAAVAYREASVLEFIEQADLAVCKPIRYGRWSGLGPAPNQDTLVLAHRS
jgi:SAM-dependent methyltransferase